jgi:hypothetical protein
MRSDHHFGAGLDIIAHRMTARQCVNDVLRATQRRRCRQG